MNGHAPLFQLNFTFDKSEMSQKENILKAEEHSVPSFTFCSVVAVLRVTSVCRSVVNLHLIPIFCDIFFQCSLDLVASITTCLLTVKTCSTIYDSLFCPSKLFKLNPIGSPFKAGEKRNFPLWDELSFSSRRYFLLKDTETEKVIFPLFLSFVQKNSPWLWN